MTHASEPKGDDKTVSLATFYAGGARFGMDILKIQEINRLRDMTPVPRAPDFVSGIVNLRGQIVTVIDLCRKLGLPEIRMKQDENRHIIVNSERESVGLLVDRICEVVRADRDKVQAPPATLGGVRGKYFEGVYQTDHSLIGILNAEAVLETRKAEQDATGEKMTDENPLGVLVVDTAVVRHNPSATGVYDKNYG